MKEKKKLRKIKNRFRVNKLFLYAFQIYKFLTNFNYIWFSFIFFTRKSFSLIIFFLNIFQKSNLT